MVRPARGEEPPPWQADQGRKPVRSGHGRQRIDHKRHHGPRVLFNPEYLEVESQVASSVVEIRKELTEAIQAACTLRPRSSDAITSSTDCTSPKIE